MWKSWFHKMMQVAATDGEMMWLSFDSGAIFTQAFNIGVACHINIFLASESLLGQANS